MGTLRVLVCLVALLALTSVAAAEEEDPDFAAFPNTAIGIGLQGHMTRIGGRSEGGVGPLIEIAVGRDRWQYTLEGSIATSEHSEWTGSAVEAMDGMGIVGHMWRGAAGARWLARQFAIDKDGGVELFLQAQIGLQRLDYDDAKLTRPEVAFGVGVQVRHYSRPRIGVRMEVRVLYTPGDREGALVACSGRCMAEAGASAGFLTGLAVSW